MEEKPPVFKNWTGWYLLVLGFLVVQVIFYLLISLRYA